MRVYSKDFTYLYDAREYLSAQVTKRYVGNSMLTLCVATGSDAAHYLQKNGWIIFDDGEPFIIKHIKQSGESVDITAYGAHKLLEQRCTVPGSGQFAIEASGSTDAVVKTIINASLRGLPIVTAAVAGGTQISDQSRLKNLGDEVLRILSGFGYGEKFTFDEVNRRIVFDTYLGADRRRGNLEDNSPVVFDQRYRNIENYTYTEDATAEQTTVYVGGSGEGTDREIIVTGNGVSGVDRVEVFVDARDVPAGDTGTLASRASQATIGMTYAITATAVADANLCYGVDYQLGDIVTTIVPVQTYVQNGEYVDAVLQTAEVHQRITEAIISRQNGEESIDLRFGDEPITPTQVQQLSAEVAQLKSVESGVKGIPSGGNAGQALIKQSSTDFDAAWSQAWTQDNDGPGSGLDADKLDGYHAASASGDWWGHIPKIGPDGVMEVGKYIDFHETDGDQSDYSSRLHSQGGVLYRNGNKMWDAGMVGELFLALHPVGSIVFNTTGVSPGSTYGGTWAAWGSGRVPVGVDTGQAEFNTGEKTGGAKTQALLANEMPSHNHSFTGSYCNTGYVSHDHSHSMYFNSGGSGGHNHDLQWNDASHKVISLSSNNASGAGSSSSGYRTGYDSGTVYSNAMKATDVSDHVHLIAGGTGGISTNHYHGVTAAGSIGNTGGGAAHNNLQP
jgi:microcystin-dependent protein